MVSAFNHTPIASTFAIDQQEKHGDLATGKCKKIMKVAYTIICASMLFFIFSCLLTIPATYIESARDQGVAILSTLPMVSNAPGQLAITGIIAAVVAMSKSSLGTYFGMIEGVSEIIKSSLGPVGVYKSRALNRAVSTLLTSAFASVVCLISPNAISIIYAISGPLIAMILSIVPTLSTQFIPALKPYCSMDNTITLVAGLLYVSVIFFSQSPSVAAAYLSRCRASWQHSRPSFPLERITLTTQSS